MRIAMVGILLFLVGPVTTAGANPYEFEFLSYLETGSAVAVAVDGSTLYTGLGQFFFVLDVSDPTKPSEVAATRVCRGYNYIRDIQITGSHAVVALGPDGLRIFDISDPANPALVGTLTGIRVWDFDVAGNTVIARAGVDFVQSIDITDVTNPSLISTVTLINYAGSPVVEDNYAYVSGSISGALHVVDVSDPSSMVEVGYRSVGVYHYSIDFEDSLVFLPTSTRDMVVVDVSDPTAPREIGRYISPATWFSSVDVVVEDSIAVLVDEYYSIDVVNVKDPSNPVRIAEIDEGIGGFKAARDGDNVYTADPSSGFRVIDVAVPESPSVVGRYQTLSSLSAIAVKD